MKKQKNFSIRLLVLAGVFLVFASSCEEDADNVPVLSITEVTEITATTARSGGNITDNGGTNVTARGVCWSTNENPTIDENKTEDGTGGGSFMSRITNLESNTTYYVRAYATNSAGIGYSSAMSFTTQKKQTVPVLSITEVTEITPTTATSGGSITDDGGTNVTARGVCWSTNENPSIDENKTEDGTSAGSFTSSITNLQSNTTYYIRAYATNSAGIGYSNAMSFTTQESASDGSLTDSRDGKVYQTVTIGTQVWMAENLAYLPSVASPNTRSQTIPYYYVYEYDGTVVADAKATANYTTYGVLYNWPAVMNGSASSTANPSGVKGVCPAGYHMPSDAEWSQLIDYSGGTYISGKLKEIGTAHWNSPNSGATNESGFTALPGGFSNGDVKFSEVGYYGLWWSATEAAHGLAWTRSMQYNNRDVYRYNNGMAVGISVRCVKN